MIPENTRVLSEQLWMSSGVVSLIDAVFLLLLTWRIKPARFRELKWPLTGTAAIFWSLYGILLVLAFWETYYQYFFPGWFRYGGILIFVPLLYGFFAWIFHLLALRMPGNPLLNFCWLAGLEAVLEHLWGIYGLKILEIPILQGASPVPILVFSFPEYILYWCIVISLANLAQNGWHWWINLMRTGMRDG